MSIEKLCSYTMAQLEGGEKSAKVIMTEKCHIASLGEDQVLGILQYLPLKSILTFGMTCRRFRQLTESEGLWAWICRREWGNMAVEAWLSVGDQKLGWKALYRQMRAPASVFARQLTQLDAIPSPRASHSLNFISGTLVLFGGGCQGGMDAKRCVILSEGDIKQVSSPDSVGVKHKDSPD
ncbi:F-box/kelch-repeat protein At1g51550-like isoform X2 [Cryptomeria japonica]|uniref:F-box/kelch-repeat protein At1g51550-like isoform X2 n=1 Tax=Cryptomeria japonica TaxID=3369 RepID=UPI0025ACD17D|nr:F-box/kelch-repeat protein At1g51550-like isoform X2 [Cryptomeria japonica]